MTDAGAGAAEVLRLPRRDQLGITGEWTLPTVNREDRDGPPDWITFEGTFLGFASSHRDTHGRHSGSDDAYALPRVDRCAACRWFEPRIFAVTNVPESYPGSDQARYLVHFAGYTIVPGEQVRVRHEWLTGAHGVIEALTTRRAVRHDEDSSEPRPPVSAYLTPPAAKVLAMAAERDDDLEHAYLNRAVS